jgi:hypothetical protein
MRKIQDIFLDIIENPRAPKNYRELNLFYKANKNNEEYDSIKYLLNQLFGENDEKSSDGTHSGTQRLQDDQGVPGQP